MGRHSTRYPAEVRDRAVRLVLEHQGEYGSQWEAMCSIASKFGCTTETLRRWVRPCRAAGDRVRPAARAERHRHGESNADTFHSSRSDAGCSGIVIPPYAEGVEVQVAVARGHAAYLHSVPGLLAGDIRRRAGRVDIAQIGGHALTLERHRAGRDATA